MVAGLSVSRRYYFVISGFLSGVNEIFALLRCYAAYIGGYRRFGTRILLDP